MAVTLAAAVALLPTSDAFSALSMQRTSSGRGSSGDGPAFIQSSGYGAADALSVFALRASRTAIPETERELYTTKKNKSKETDNQGKRPFKNDERPVANGRSKGDMEYLQDDDTELRGMSDPHHILLMGFETFSNERITVPYVTGSLIYVLEMPEMEAADHAAFAKDEGMSCLGTWPRKECLELGSKLQQRDLACRIVPGSAAGAQGWQAKDASASLDTPSIQSE
jgi:hypothetical protein